MLEWIRHLRQQWNNWSGDREMELAIRRHLTDVGCYGQTAQLRNVRLIAVQRPGWLQIYRFEATARVRPNDTGEELPDAAPEYLNLLGLVRDDIRYEVLTVRTFETETARRELFEAWSENLICLRPLESR